MPARAIAILFALALTLFSQSANAQDMFLQDPQEGAPLFEKKTYIVLDPGHGGTDLGARSSKGMLEKTVSFKLANLVKNALEGYPGLSVHMTRDGDISREKIERIEFANSMEASLFVSFHTNGGKFTQSGPRYIFIPENGDHEKEEWRSQNKPFNKKNLKLANIIKANLERKNEELEIVVFKSDRLFLEGLAMPAVMLEVVDLANPKDELNLDDQNYIKSLSRTIAYSVASFLGLN